MKGPLTMCKVFLGLFVMCSIMSGGLPKQGTNQQRISLENSKIISIVYTRLHLDKDSLQDYYNYNISFQTADSVLTVNYKSQAPVLNIHNQPILLVMENHCLFEIGKLYSFTLTKKCFGDVKMTFYNSYAAAFDKNDCSAFKLIESKSIKVIPSFHSNLFDLNDSLYEITEFKNCNGKYIRIK